MYPFYLGIDLHLKRTYLVLMNGEGEVIDKQRLKNAEIASWGFLHIPSKRFNPDPRKCRLTFGLASELPIRDR